MGGMVSVTATIVSHMLCREVLSHHRINGRGSPPESNVRDGTSRDESQVNDMLSFHEIRGWYNKQFTPSKEELPIAFARLYESGL